MKQLCLSLLLLICTSAFTQDKVFVFRNNGTIDETETSSIDSITFPDDHTMRVHHWNAMITDIPISEIDSMKLIPDQGTTETDRKALIALITTAPIIIMENLLL